MSLIFFVAGFWLAVVVPPLSLFLKVLVSDDQMACQRSHQLWQGCPTPAASGYRTTMHLAANMLGVQATVKQKL